MQSRPGPAEEAWQLIPAEIRGDGNAARMKSGTPWTKSRDRTMRGSLRDRAGLGASQGEEKR